MALTIDIQWLKEHGKTSLRFKTFITGCCKMAIDVKQLQTIIDNPVTQEMRDFANTPDADKNRLRQLRQKDVLDSFSPNPFLPKLNLIYIY